MIHPERAVPTYQRYPYHSSPNILYRVAALPNDPADRPIAVHHDDMVRVGQHLEMMRHEDTGAIGQRPSQNAIVQDMAADLRIDSREGVVQEHNIAFSVCCASDADALLLSAREVDAALPDLCAVDVSD